MTPPNPTNLSGPWRGHYAYPVRRPEVPFDAAVIETDGHLGGSITELADTGPDSGRPLYATISGTRTGGVVSFRKTYEGDQRFYAVVDYAGRLNADATEIKGTWTIHHESGPFVMTRPIQQKAAATRKIAEPV